jgi:hypothetical protein
MVFKKFSWVGNIVSVDPELANFKPAEVKIEVVLGLFSKCDFDLHFSSVPLALRHAQVNVVSNITNVHQNS